MCFRIRSDNPEAFNAFSAYKRMWAFTAQVVVLELAPSPSDWLTESSIISTWNGVILHVCVRMQNPPIIPELFLVICIAYYFVNYSGIFDAGLMVTIATLNTEEEFRNWDDFDRLTDSEDWKALSSQLFLTVILKL